MSALSTKIGWDRRDCACAPKYCRITEEGSLI